jgi:hypothetical protein
LQLEPKGPCVAWRHEKSIVTVPYKLRYSTNPGRYHRCSQGERFQVNQTESFAVARYSGDSGRGHSLEHGPVVDRSEERALLINMEFPREALALRSAGSISQKLDTNLGQKAG